MGYFVRPGLVAVADISATLRVRFPFRVPPERWGPFTRASGCVPRPRSTCVGSVVIGGGGASTGGAGGGGRTRARARRAHRPGALRRRCPRRHRVNRSAVARRRRCERHASRRRAARASLRVRRLGHQRQRRREHARRGRRRRGQGHVQVDRAPVVVVVLFVAFDRSSSWRVLGEFDRRRWKMLIECSHVPVCCGCYVFLFGFRNRRAPSPCQRTVPDLGRFSIVVCVSRVLFSSSGGALVARFGGIWSLEMEGACRVCPRACLLRLLRVSVHVSQSSRTQPMPTSSPQSWSVFDRRFGFGVSGALLFFWWGACGTFLGKFGRWRRKMLVVCARPRLFVVAVACCCLSELPCNLPVPMSAPNPGRFRSSFRCLGCVSLLLVAFWDMWISTNFVPDCRHHM